MLALYRSGRQAEALDALPACTARRSSTSSGSTRAPRSRSWSGPSCARTPSLELAPREAATALDSRRRPSASRPRATARTRGAACPQARTRGHRRPRPRRSRRARGGGRCPERALRIACRPRRGGEGGRVRLHLGRCRHIEARDRAGRRPDPRLGGPGAPRRPRSRRAAAHRPLRCGRRRRRRASRQALSSCRSPAPSTTGARSSSAPGSPAAGRCRSGSPALPSRAAATRAACSRAPRSRFSARSGSRRSRSSSRPGPAALVEASADAAIAVVGLSDRWRKDGLGPTRSALAPRDDRRSSSARAFGRAASPRPRT